MFVLLLVGVVILPSFSATQHGNIKEIVVPPNYAINPLKAKRLAITEEIIVNTLKVTANKKNQQGETKCNQIVDKYLKSYNQDWTALEGKTANERANTIVESGLLIFKMIQRILQFIDPIKKNVCNDVLSQIEGIFYDKNLELPSSEDLDDALKGLLRIQYIYGFNATSHLRFGVFGTTETKVTLNFENCLSLAKKASSMQGYALAYQWLSAATNLATSPNDIISVESALSELTQKSNSANLKDLQEKFDGKIQTTLLDHDNYTDYATCRGETGTGQFATGDTYCFYNHMHPFFRISPVKTEVLSEDPVVVQYHDILDKDDMKFLKESADTKQTGRRKFKKEEKGVHNLPDFVTHTLIALNDYIYHGREKSLNKLDRKLEMVTGFKMKKDTSTQTQIMLYGPIGGYFDIHHDAFQTFNLGLTESGERIVTLFLYLSDVKMGGYTAFPHLGVYAKPEKGSALIWYNVKKNGAADFRTMHTGCPVILGEKLAVRRGIFQMENMWTFPCSLSMKG